MSKNKVIYLCTLCGNDFNSWSGKCTSCGEWNTLEEKKIVSKSIAGNKISNGKNIEAGTIDESIASNQKRLQIGIKELDDIFGGGVVPGGVTLIAGEPGIGKSTLLMQIASNVSTRAKVLYISGEESVSQISMRSKRLGLSSKKNTTLLTSSNSANDIAFTIENNSYDLVIVDSIQTIAIEEITSTAGSVAQITNSAYLIINSAKKKNTAVIFVGHVTKDGNIAGPKVLEHLVDTVINFEGNRYGELRLVRCLKNRFGPTTDVVIFEMKEDGLKIVQNPSATLLEERIRSDGSIVLATIEGSKPILVEVQALVNKTSYGYPKRASSGFDLNRLNLLIAMLERRTKLNLSDKDVFVNIVGGLKINEPAADLAIIIAIATAASELIPKHDYVVFGEVGLSGEVRTVAWPDKRINEAHKLGFKYVLGPKSNKDTENSKVIYQEITEIKHLNKILKRS